jgi:hypothetical protein
LRATTTPNPALTNALVLSSHTTHHASLTNGTHSRAATPPSESRTATPGLRLAWLARSRQPWTRERELWRKKSNAEEAYANRANISCLQAGFYICLSAIPLSLAVYKFTGQGTSEKPYFTRLIQDTYADYKGKWAQRNDSHTRAMEQAAADRSLFIHEANNTTRHVELKFPEYVLTSSVGTSDEGKEY